MRRSPRVQVKTHLNFVSHEYRGAALALVARRPDLYGIGITPHVVQAMKESA